MFFVSEKRVLLPPQGEGWDGGDFTSRVILLRALRGLSTNRARRTRQPAQFTNLLSNCQKTLRSPGALLQHLIRRARFTGAR